ncbi:PAS domain-containing hybrid sensor histidine kinase/response regulator [Limnovirga soli]|uniref:Sensory/regulatory protein RpfC n=1 Tax=Limnovirga soli TaxID=2656915 RepID=A0A8J8JRX7_9BACT|nr:PAS domain-containing hybrid sensor histidine kinase/response regulator [Limnovirga soli]NNV56342.1 PAS domain S-box protein [Limnovirga soli]
MSSKSNIEIELNKSLYNGIQSKKASGFFSNPNEVMIFVMVVGAIFLSEMIIMLFLKALPDLSEWESAILDATLLSVLIFPVIYIFLYKPLKKNIAARRKREASYASLIESMGEGVGICNNDEQFIFANIAAEKIFGVGRGELNGKNLKDFFTKENFDFITNQTAQRREGKFSVYETEIILSDGTQKSILVTASPQIENGLFIGTLGIFRDISDLKKAQETIQYERMLLRALIDNLPDSVYVKDIECRKVIANPVDLKYMGFEKEEDVLGKNDYDIYPKEIADSSFADDQAVFKTGMPQLNKEDFFIDNNGQKRWMLNSKVPIRDEKGKIIGLVGIGRDISHKKNEETRLQLMESVITNTTDAVTITEVDPNNHRRHKIIFVNDAYSKITGYSKEEVIGKSPKILQGPKTDKTELHRVGESIKNFQPCRFEVINYKKNREEFWSSISLSPIAGNNGQYTHWIAIKRDITDSKALEQEFISAKEKAEAGSKAKSEFLANMSHEIRTPLNSVIGFSDLVLKTQLDETQEQYISAVYKSANSLLDIINEILDFSKIEAGKLEIEIHKTDILELGYQIGDIVSFQAYEKNLELLLNISPYVPRFIWTDAVRIRQILINLLGNAVKFTAKGEIELKIELLSKAENDIGCFRFSVRDTGIGIDPKNQQKIFEAFSQEDASTTRKFGGTGLGLAISKKLLSLMGSELQLQSIPDEGSTFFFELCTKTMEGDPIEWKNTHQYKNILLVDDNTNNRLLVKDMLALKQINTREAENGLRAIEFLKAGIECDAVIMDYHMPQMDGLETIKYIRQTLQITAEKLPIILLHSSADDKEINDTCKSFGVIQKLVKPIKMQQLFESLSKTDAHQKQLNAQTDSTSGTTNKSSYKNSYVKVLVVDDNAFNIMLITAMLGELLPNATLIEATNGKEAFDRFKEEYPDIVFMDVQMPEMNGYQATAAIRNIEKGSRVPIIALTAGVLKEDRDKSLEAGMNDFVAKPFVIETIEQVLEKWLITKPKNFNLNWDI